MSLIVPFGYLYIVPDKLNMTLLMIVISSVFLIIDLTRNKNNFIRNIFNRYFAFMLREHEKGGRLTGATWVVLASIPMIYFFPKEIAVLSLVFMSMGDIAAGLVGRSFGRTSIGKKTIEGSIGCLTICVLVAYMMDIVPFTIGMVGAIFATVFELLPINIDDNLLIPVGSGTAMAIASTFI